MDSDLPKLPSLEEVLKAMGDIPETKSSETASQINQQYPIKMNCPILRRKTGDGEIDMLEDSVVCEYFVEKTNYRNEDLVIVHLHGCGLKKDSKSFFKRRRFFPYGDCPLYEEYADTSGDIHWAQLEDSDLNLTADELREEYGRGGII